jgi:hypothetical protein
MVLYDASGNALSDADARGMLGAGPSSSNGGSAGNGADPIVRVQNLTSKTVLPTLSGKEGSAGIIRFIDQIDRAMVQTHYSDEQMASTVVSQFTANARLWAEARATLLEDEGFLLWSTLRTLIRTEFVRCLSVVEINDLRSGLIQKSDENVQAFMHRCTIAHGNININATREQKLDDVYKANLEREVKVSFVNGLKPAVRAALQTLDLTSITLAALLTVAINAELNARRAGQVTEKSIDAAVEAAFHRFGGTSRGGRGNPSRGGRGGGRGGFAGGFARGRGSGETRGRGSFAPRGRGSFSRGGGYSGAKKLCYRCGLVGNHIKATCSVDLAKLKTQRRGRFAADFNAARLEASLSEESALQGMDPLTDEQEEYAEEEAEEGAIAEDSYSAAGN